MYIVIIMYATQSRIYWIFNAKKNDTAGDVLVDNDFKVKTLFVFKFM